MTSFSKNTMTPWQPTNSQGSFSKLLRCFVMITRRPGVHWIIIVVWVIKCSGQLQWWSSAPALHPSELAIHLYSVVSQGCWQNQNCKPLFMYVNNWDKGVALAICPCIFGTWESKYAGAYSWSHTYLQRVLYHVMDTLLSGWDDLYVTVVCKTLEKRVKISCIHMCKTL